MSHIEKAPLNPWLAVMRVSHFADCQALLGLGWGRLRGSYGTMWAWIEGMVEHEEHSLVFPLGWPNP